MYTCRLIEVVTVTVCSVCNTTVCTDFYMGRGFFKETLHHVMGMMTGVIDSVNANKYQKLVRKAFESSLKALILSVQVCFHTEWDLYCRTERTLLLLTILELSIIHSKAGNDFVQWKEIGKSIVRKRLPTVQNKCNSLTFLWSFISMISPVSNLW